ncbi:MAG: hypothetical protein O3A88_01330 [Proteobacteria bacterium]|nr:hypothetical protein [Pseudomonadota bacterium]
MAESCDVLVSGTGNFGSRIVFDIAVTAKRPVKVAIGGRNLERMNWLSLAANARANIFGTPAEFQVVPIRYDTPESVAESIGKLAPKVVVQAASVQSSAVISQSDTAWSRLVAQAGLSTTAIFQVLLSARVGKAMQMLGNNGPLLNCCYPDVANGMLKAIGLPVTCGAGNVAILATMFGGDLGIREPGRVKVLAHYACLDAWRRAPAERAGKTEPRVWIDGKETGNLFNRFSHLKLTREPVIDISGCTGVPIILALASGDRLVAHAPGPNGLIGGYPILVENGAVRLDLPAGVSESDAIAWNRGFEERNGMLVDDKGWVRFTGNVQTEFARHSPELAKGLDITDIEHAAREMGAFRDRLMAA